MLREDHPDISPTTAFRSLSTTTSPHHGGGGEDNGSSALDDIFGEPSPPRAPTVLSQLDDVFGCSPPRPHALHTPNPGVVSSTLESSSLPLTGGSATHHDVSDIPRLRSIHVTAGYRDGIAASKAEHVQDGFDEGFPLGATLGLLAGRVVGVLEGVVAALSKTSISATARQKLSGAQQQQEQEHGSKVTHESARQLLAQARAELDVAALVGPEFFDDEGIWRFGVDGQEDEVTFAVVAAQHPVVARWMKVVEELASDLRLDLGVLDRRGRGGEEEGDGESKMMMS
ncbi:hypothetical protein HDK90DRAFT_455725 [Phyllosticta capitalensis]|uniref:Protein YAE1 n=1 Tax=Phyllosticta capitalensis TaxID=121624 RepID=A0ABR1YI86_9PEZI